MVCVFNPNMEISIQITKKYNGSTMTNIYFYDDYFGQDQNFKINRNDVVNKIKEYLDFVPIGQLISNDN